MNETAKILNQNEKVIWEGRPQFVPYMAALFPMIIFGLIWTGISSFFLYGTITNAQGNNIVWSVVAVISLFVFIGLYLLIGNTIVTLLLYKRIWYVITDKRIIFQKGLIGRDFDIVDYDKIESASVDVGLFDKIFGTNSGSIAIYANRLVSDTVTDSQGGTSTSTRNVPFVLYYITDPYAVFELFKNVSFDIKADINYPNALRPKENPGYQTEYKREETKS